MGGSGTILVADYVERATSGKCVIAGTYTKVFVGVDQEQMGQAVNVPLPAIFMYLRFTPERIGDLPFAVRLVPGNSAPWEDSKLFQFEGKQEVKAEMVNMAMEVIMSLPPNVIALPVTLPPVDPAKTMAHVSPMRLELLVDGDLIASCAYDVECREHKAPQT